MRFELIVTRDKKEIYNNLFGYKFEAARWLERYIRIENLPIRRYKTLTLYKNLFPSKTNFCKVEINDIVSIIKKGRKGNK